MKKLNIGNLKEGELWNPSYGGKYIDKRGDTYLLSNPQADTLRVMQNLSTAEEQFEFYCYAYIRERYFRTRRIVAVEKRQIELGKKFGYIWNGNARIVLPPSEFTFFSGEGLTEKGLDVEHIKKGFDGCSEYTFILY